MGLGRGRRQGRVFRGALALNFGVEYMHPSRSIGVDILCYGVAGHVVLVFVRSGLFILISTQHL